MELFQRVTGEVRKGITECLERSGGHQNDVIFGMQDFCFQCVKVKLKKKIYIILYIKYRVFICVKTK